MDTLEELAKSSPLNEKTSRVKLGFGFDYYFLPKDTVISLFKKLRTQS